MRPEQVYVLALRAYPRRWRDRRQTEVLGVLMDAAADRGAERPGAREVGNLLVHGVAARLRAVTEPVGQGLRDLTARLALSSLVVLTVMTVAFGEVWPWERAGVLPYDRPAGSWDGRYGPFFTAGGPFLALSLLLCLSGLAGRTRVIQAALPVCAAALVAVSVVGPLLGLNRPAVWTVVGVAVLAALTTIGDATPSKQWALWTLAAAAAGAAEIWTRMQFAADPRPFFYYQRLGDSRPSLALAFLLGAVVVGVIYHQLLGVLPVIAAWLLILGLQQYSAGQPQGALAFGGLAVLFIVAALATLIFKSHTVAEQAAAQSS